MKQNNLKPVLEKDEFCISLTFSGDNLDPTEITKLLGCEPSDSARKGDPNVRLTKNTGRTFNYPGGWWNLKTERSTHDIEEQLTKVFSRLTQDLKVWQVLTSRYEADLFCGVFLSWFGHGFSMSPHLHRQLADRNLLITFDIYAEYDRDAETSET